MGKKCTEKWKKFERQVLSWGKISYENFMTELRRNGVIISLDENSPQEVIAPGFRSSQ